MNDNCSAVEVLYFGSNANKVLFKPCKGIFQSFDSFELKSDSSSSQTVIQRQNNSPSFMKQEFGEEYSHLLIPGLPCLDLQKTENKTISIENIPELISKQPLIKAKNNTTNISSSMVGYGSGIRSAILPLTSKTNEMIWYRLKGCGNKCEEHFPFECMDDGHSPTIQIRGCSFIHTTLREMKMTKDIRDICLLPQNIACANHRILGYYHYNIDRYLPKISRCCTIFETLGNRRLGDHLLQGLRRLLPMIVDCQQMDVNEIWNAFPDIRRLSNADANDGKMLEINKNANVMETYLAVSCEIELLNLKDHKSIGIPLKNIQFESENESKNMVSDDILWKKECEKLNKMLSLNSSQLLIDMYFELGYESGFILAVLHSHKISWGTYSDLMGTHCNAHANNYVILPKNTCMQFKSGFFLAPLDFDMAFYEHEYICDLHKMSFEELLILEMNGNRISLAGDPQISTGVHYLSEISEKEPMIDLIHWSLMDTLISGFDAGYNCDLMNHRNRMFEMNEKRLDFIYNLFNLALIITNKVIA